MNNLNNSIKQYLEREDDSGQIPAIIQNILIDYNTVLAGGWCCIFSRPNYIIYGFWYIILYIPISNEMDIERCILFLEDNYQGVIIIDYIPRMVPKFWVMI